jgi:hypothetical protein
MQALVCLLGCMLARRWHLPFTGRQGDTKHYLTDMLISQFKYSLWGHMVFYIAELNMTRVWEMERMIAYHHVFSLFLMPAGIYFYNEIASFTLVLPFVVHSFYWSFEDPPDPLVYLYNVLLFICCAASILRFRRTVGHLSNAISITNFWRHPVSVPIYGLAVFVTNCFCFMERL